MKFTDHVAMAVDSPVKREAIPAEPRAVEPTSHRQNLIALRDQLASLLVSKVWNKHDTKMFSQTFYNIVETTYIFYIYFL